MTPEQRRLQAIVAALSRHSPNSRELLKARQDYLASQVEAHAFKLWPTSSTCDPISEPDRRDPTFRRERRVGGRCVNQQRRNGGQGHHNPTAASIQRASNELRHHNDTAYQAMPEPAVIHIPELLSTGGG